MYGRRDFLNSLQRRFDRPDHPNVISDVYDSQLYKHWVNNGFSSNPHNISFSWYTDGIPVFKSSKISTWSIYVSINELPCEERKNKNNTLLLGLWYGEKKSHFNTFIYPSRSIFEKLFTGIKVVLPNRNEIIVRAVVLMVVCDLPAKCECLNFVQFNGKYGCPVCFSIGEVIQIAPRSHIQVCPYTDQFELRTSRRCEELALHATPHNPQFGVKGYTALSKLMPDFLGAMCIDRMHAVDAGVIKKLLTLFFHVSHSNDRFSLNGRINDINSRLLMIKPPKFIHRIPRTTNDLIHWKVSELKSFYYYYSIAVFEGIMSIEYFNHYLLLVISMFILSADKISHLMIDVAEDLLRRFVREFSELYGIRYLSIDVHLLLHMSYAVRQTGPLWAHTCYEYEDMNGEMLNLIHGTRCIGSQVVNGHSYSIKMVKYVEKIRNENVKKFCLNKKKQSFINEKIFDDCYSVGVYKLLDKIPDLIMTAMRNSLVDINGTFMWSF